MGLEESAGEVPDKYSGVIDAIQKGSYRAVEGVGYTIDVEVRASGVGKPAGVRIANGAQQ